MFLNSYDLTSDRSIQQYKKAKYVQQMNPFIIFF